MTRDNETANSKKSLHSLLMYIRLLIGLLSFEINCDNKLTLHVYANVNTVL